MSADKVDHPTTTTNELCDICSAIPFTASVGPHWFDQFRSDNTLSLGLLESIRTKKQCPLCRLIVLAAYETQRGWAGLLHGEVSLKWRSFMGTGGGLQLMGSGWTGYGTAICFVNDAIPPTSGDEVCSFIPILGSQLDVSRARGWITACESYHGDTCDPKRRQSVTPIIPGLEVLRLIDVRKGCLVEVRSHCRYLTLSYVWGGVNNVRLTSSNMASFKVEGVLQTIWNLLPRTIQDAIEIVKALGERFLWIDALCLIQNDAVDMRSGIEVMDLIYETAVVSIIAASGDNANSGLPGVLAGSRLASNHIEQIEPGVRLAIYNELDHLLRPSAYNRRAWT